MKKLTINNREILVYDSIDELPMVNFQKYNKYMLIDSGIGSDINDIDTHISRLAKYIKSDVSKAMQELQNMRQNLYMISSGISPKHLAFATLIHSIDGKEVTDLSDDNLKSILDSINTVKRSWLVDLLISIKKKISTELELYFPEEFTSVKEKDAYDKLKSRTLLVLEGIRTGNKNTSDIDTIDEYLFSLHKPNSFIGSASIEIQYDKQFEAACIAIAQKTNLNAKHMTVLQFYSAVDSIKQQTEAEQKILNRHKRK